MSRGTIVTFLEYDPNSNIVKTLKELQEQYWNISEKLDNFKEYHRLYAKRELIEHEMAKTIQKTIIRMDKETLYTIFFEIIDQLEDLETSDTLYQKLFNEKDLIYAGIKFHSMKGYTSTILSETLVLWVKQQEMEGLIPNPNIKLSHKIEVI